MAGQTVKNTKKTTSTSTKISYGSTNKPISGGVSKKKKATKGGG